MADKKDKDEPVVDETKQDDEPNEATKLPDAEWVETQDVHTGDEPGEPERTEAKLESVAKQQPEHGIGEDQIAQLEEVEELKRKASQEAADRTKSTDFEQGERQEEMLRGGVPARQAFEEQEKVHARMRRETGAYHDNDEVAGRDKELLGDEG